MELISPQIHQTIKEAPAVLLYLRREMQEAVLYLKLIPSFFLCLLEPKLFWLTIKPIIQLLSFPPPLCLKRKIPISAILNGKTQVYKELRKAFEPFNLLV